VWTGTELIVIQYTDSDGPGAVGVRLNPQSGQWRTISESPLEPVFTPRAVWTGELMLLLSGADDQRPTMSANAAYSPAGDTWVRLAPPHASGFSASQPVWTGSYVFFHGLRPMAFDLEGNRWARLALPPPAAARVAFGAAWTGRSVIVWGGSTEEGGRAVDAPVEFIPAGGS
jgi:hypothetical protein